MLIYLTTTNKRGRWVQNCIGKRNWHQMATQIQGNKWEQEMVNNFKRTNSVNALSFTYLNDKLITTTMYY